MGERALSLVQYGLENPVAHGVAVPTTRIALKVVEPLAPDRVPSFPEEDFGARAKSLRSWIGQNMVSDTLTFEHAYYEMLPLMFNCGLQGAIVSIANGAAWDWTYTPLLRGINAPDSFTLQKADDVAGVNYETTYAMFERINIKGTINQGAEASPVTVTGDFFAREWKVDTLTVGQEPITTWPLNAKLTTLHIDALWANLGTTPMDATLRAFDIDIMTGVHPKMLGSALKTFDIDAEGIIHVTSAFTFEGNLLAVTEYGHYLTQTDRAYRLQINNPASPVASLLRIDCFGRWREVIPFADEDRGNNLFTLVHESILDPTIFATPDMLDVFMTISTQVV
jgi:hypothetical protein